MSTSIAKLQGHGLGCRFARDPRDQLYSLERRLDVLDWEHTAERLSPWRHGPILDQGETSECTRYSLAARRGAAPIFTKSPLADVTYGYYDWAINNDEFPGADPAAGTTVRAMCQAGRKYLPPSGQYLLSNFYSTATELTVRRYLTRFGPINVGTEWTDKMFTPDAAGYVVPTGAVAGGHAYCALWLFRVTPGVDSMDDTYLFQNSWGSTWGIYGLFRMRAGDVLELLEHRGGEAFEPVEIRHHAK